jgi:hypothetical protein
MGGYAHKLSLLIHHRTAVLESRQQGIGLDHARFTIASGKTGQAIQISISVLDTPRRYFRVCRSGNAQTTPAP